MLYAGLPATIVDPTRQIRLASTLKAVIFDWDLTLWNSWDIHVYLMDITADDLGQSRPVKGDIAREYSRPFLEHLAWFFGDELGDERDLILDTYIGHYRETVGEMASLYPGIAETLMDLKGNGLKLGVFSDKRQPFGISELEQTGVGHLLDHASFLVEGRPYKPDPQGLRDVMDALGVSPPETLYIGDSRQDIRCAHRAGTHSGAALWGSVDREGVLAEGPQFQWDRPELILGSLGIQGDQSSGGV